MSSNLRYRALVAAFAVAVAGLFAVATPANASLIVSVVSSSTSVDSVGYRHIVGELRNDGTATADFVQLNLSYLDQSERLLKTDITYAALSPFSPGEKSPFETAFEPPAGYHHYEIAVDPDSTTSRPNRNVTTTITNEFTDSIGYRHLVGTVRNNNTTTATFVQPVFTFYDAAGTVVETERTYVRSNDSADIAPGATANVEVTVNGDRAYSTYVVATQASSPPSGVASSPSPAASPGGGTPSSPSPAPTQTAELAPAVSVAPSVISAGQRMAVTYSGTPNSTLTVLSKTQPATGYSRITTVTLDGSGYGSTSHAPTKNTRIMAQTANGLSSTQPLVQVRSVASFTAQRTAPRTYTLTGKVYPARDQRLVSVYRNGALVAQGRTNSTGVYALRTTLAAGTFSFQARTGDDTYNLGAVSPAKTVRLT
ncbi:MAG: hypothetical protein JWN57_633 [Frankiales bacterium]|nr:hypothetical protein [Frankiales bacterium]